MPNKKSKNERGPLTPKRKQESFPSIRSDDFDGPSQFFGFNTPSKDGAAVFSETEAALCMATEVSDADVASLAVRGVTARAGEWVVSSGDHDSPSGMVFHGPFKTMDEAFAAASEAYGVTRWVSGTQSL